MRHQFFTGDTAIAWLRVVTRNACLDILKHKKLRSEKLSEVSALMQNIGNEFYHEDLLAELLKKCTRLQSHYLPRHGKSFIFDTWRA